ncbi:hypothetical protein EYC98_09480 [Halieaceae bacterium IMCC14734]|uniref:Uncharacterized protein n=1 Tax=Candidatus Litorirhabdus singularis TaxID=2518993 RepID=A0ABT3TFN1_9GAMM|nr:hypothetical protein [Candidatus Litorirhabdus singularis]MCX2981093.1 hypothetical protein [Candidatus Litorirhabdus singularis]
MVSLTSRVFKLATAPARFAVQQTRTNLKALNQLRQDYRAYEPIFQQAAAETADNIVKVLVAAEQSLPPDIANLTPGEREQQIRDSLARGERHLLAAFGELYRSYRLISTTDPSVIIENPSQRELQVSTTVHTNRHSNLDE